METDLSLRPIIKKHLPPVKGENVLYGYSDELLALKFFEFFRAGRQKFGLIRTPTDIEELRKLSDALQRVQSALGSLGRPAKDILNDKFNEFGLGLSPIQHWNISDAVDRDLRSEGSMGESDSDKDSFEEDCPSPRFGELAAPSVSTFSSQLDGMIESVDEALFSLDFFGIEGQMDWGVCAVTLLAKKAWRSRKGEWAPKTAHADTPGPFGRFLEDILAELYLLSGRQSDKPPTARSALRALAIITNKPIEFLGNW